MSTKEVLTQQISDLEALTVLLKEDGAKFLEKGNNAAGTRVRKHALEVGKLTKEIRKSVSAVKDEA